MAVYAGRMGLANKETKGSRDQIVNMLSECIPRSFSERSVDPDLSGLQGSSIDPRA